LLWCPDAQELELIPHVGGGRRRPARLTGRLEGDPQTVEEEVLRGQFFWSVNWWTRLRCGLKVGGPPRSFLEVHCARFQAAGFACSAHPGDPGGIGAISER